jgi:hypothetical protein
MRGRVCRLQLLLALASAVILGFESRGTRGHILLSQIRDFPFRRLLRLAGSRWRYSTPPPHGFSCGWCRYITPSHGPHRKHRFQQFLYCCACNVGVRTCLFVKSLPSNGSTRYNTVKSSFNVVVTFLQNVTLCENDVKRVHFYHSKLKKQVGSALRIT